MDKLREYIGVKKQKIKCSIYNKFYINKYISKKNVVLCCGIQKCGNTHLWFLLANYIALEENFSDKPLTYEQMRSILPSSWGEKNQIINIQTPIIALKKFGFENFIVTHKEYTNQLNVFSKIIHLYRNPLDFIISLWFYWYVYRENAEKIEIDTCLQRHLDMFISKYKSYKKNKHSILLSYEELQKNSANSLRSVLEYISPSMNVCSKNLELAVKFSDKNLIAKYETKHGPIHAPKGYKGQFVRDGRIGQWKEYFNNTSINFCKQKLKKAGLSWSEFTFE